MKDWEINKTNRKDWGDVKPVEKVHLPYKQKNSGRGAMKRQLDDMVGRFSDYEEDDSPIPRRLIGGKKHTAMQALKREKGTSVIPKGCYCYDENGTCPFWDKIEGKPEQLNGFCWFMLEGDWDTAGELWDQCKHCGHNPGDEKDYGIGVEPK